MKNILILFALASLLFACKKPPIDEPSNQDSTETSYQWTRLADFPGNFRDPYIHYAVGTDIYIGLSFCVSQMWKYATTDNTWQQLPDLPQYSSIYPLCFAIGNKIYAIGGYGCGGVNTSGWETAWQFDTETNAWQPYVNWPVGYSRPAFTFTFKDKAYMLGSYYDNTISEHVNFFYVFDGVVFTKLDSCPSQYIPNISFTIEDKVYIGLPNEKTPSPNEFWEYAPETDTWKRLNDFTGGIRISASAFSLHGKGYVMGGETNNASRNDIWEYTPQDDTWKKVADIPFGALLSAGVATVDNQVYIFLNRHSPSESWKLTVN